MWFRYYEKCFRERIRIASRKREETRRSAPKSRCNEYEYKEHDEIFYLVRDRRKDGYLNRDILLAYVHSCKFFRRYYNQEDHIHSLSPFPSDTGTSASISLPPKYQYHYHNLVPLFHQGQIHCPLPRPCIATKAWKALLQVSSEAVEELYSLFPFFPQYQLLYPALCSSWHLKLESFRYQ